MIYTGVYRNLWQYSQPLEYFRMVVMLFGVGVIWFVLNRAVFAYLGYVLPFYFYVLVVALLIIYFSCSRFVLRWLYDFVFNRHKQKVGAGRATLIVGAGSACTTLLAEIQNTEQCGIRPVVAVDSDPAKHGRSILGVPIAGDASMIPDLCEKHKIDLIIIAIPSATNRRRAELIRECAKTGLEVKTLPRVHDFEKEDRSFLQKLREITPDELLGREPVVLDNPKVAAFTHDKTVLITGGGGSIGSELCRQIAQTKPRKLIIVDIYENNAYDIQQELLRAHGNELNLSVIIASVRDYDRLLDIFIREKPDLCIHAAAHKHVPLMETSPGEAVKNNIFGTLNMARAALEAKVSKVILISTDKAVNPTNVMGATKRVCEMIVQSMNNETTAFSAVRFGNVLGSNGSVIPLFKKQIEQGGPVTVTHPEIIRYFMTIPEAVQLVLTAGALAKGGETFVLDMGQPVKIIDLAQTMIDLTGRRDIEIQFTGLRPGEKLY
ncbi:MAG: polysaccharide biosynthesis protein, partial [Oscillospiraceae bacterium]|nr:polysaccharide biosynthesis protein [Oscillospiraceae bacterium]